MLKIGYAQEIFTPPTGVGLAGYFNERPNEGMYDDLYVKAVAIESNGTKFGFVTFDLCSLHQAAFDELKKCVVEKFGQEIYDNFIFSATHSHTASLFPGDRSAWNDRTEYAFRQMID